MELYQLLGHFGTFGTFDILKKHIKTFFRPKTKSNFGIHCRTTIPFSIENEAKSVKES